MVILTIRTAVHVTAATLAFHTGSTRLLAQCTPADKSALEAFDKAWGEATVRGDRAAVTNFVADNYMGINVYGTVDKPALLATNERNAARNAATPAPVATADRYVISCTPLTATISHRNTAVDATTKLPSYSRSLHFLEKRGGKWQVVSSTGHALTDAQQLLYIEQDWNDAILRHDADWIEKTYAPFASDISYRTGALENKAQAVASMKSDKTVYEALDLSELTAHVEGDVGVVTGVNRLRGKDADGKAFDRRARFTDTYIKRDGRWQVWTTQGTTIP
ncbi:MAG: nuclear transport factor 2 family protein [Gemmatimonadota bacterium]|nr:nuclear transport factor 2 family protein [Gemmatimonadota bacterium]